MIELRIRHRLRGFTLDVDASSAGPVLGVFGRSGSGKTTLLNALAGILRPREARILLDGKLLGSRPGRWHPPEARRLALVPQDPLLFPHLSCARNLVYAPGAAAELASPRGRKIVEVLRLGALLDRRPSTLSGGERQRVALGRALLARPRALLLDEPLAALDAELAREILSLLMEVKRSVGGLMVLVTHRPSELLALADDCLVLEAGRVVAQGAPLEVLARPRAVGIARLAGVDNLLRLPVKSHDEPGGVSLLDLGGTELAVPLTAAPPGSMVDVGLYAEDVILCAGAPGRVSARNALPARLRALDRIGHEYLVRLEVGGVELCSRVTPGAAREMDLRPGAPLVILVKTTACHLLGEP